MESTENNTNNLRIRIRKGHNELEVQIPLTPRTMIGLDPNGTGTNTLKMVEELIEKINKL